MTLMLTLEHDETKLINTIDLFTIDLLEQETRLQKAQKPPGVDPYVEFLFQLTKNWNSQVDKAIVDAIAIANKFLQTDNLTPQVIDAMTESFNNWLGPALANNPDVQRVNRKNPIHLHLKCLSALAYRKNG